MSTDHGGGSPVTGPVAAESGWLIRERVRLLTRCNELDAAWTMAAAAAELLRRGIETAFGLRVPSGREDTELLTMVAAAAVGASPGEGSVDADRDGDGQVAGDSSDGVHWAASGGLTASRDAVDPLALTPRVELPLSSLQMAGIGALAVVDIDRGRGGSIMRVYHVEDETRAREHARTLRGVLLGLPLVADYRGGADGG